MSDAVFLIRKVLLIGTHHTYQYGAGSAYFGGCTQEEESAFRHLVQRLAHRFEVSGLAEELNEDGLSQHKVRHSVLQQEASALQLPHCFCEPGLAERADLGIRQSNEVKATGWIRGWSNEEVKSALLDEFKKREAVWCDRLLVQDAWPVLFVCGADHVPSFSSLLLERGLKVEVLETCWEAQPSSRK